MAVDKYGFINADIHIQDKTDKSKTLVLEIDGPTHFITENRVRSCHDIVRKSVLRGLGVKVQTLNYMEWEALDFKNEEKNLLLMKKLDPESY